MPDHSSMIFGGCWAWRGTGVVSGVSAIWLGMRWWVVLGRQAGSGMNRRCRNARASARLQGQCSASAGRIALAAADAGGGVQQPLAHRGLGAI